jgi:hypothetical protein
MVAEEKGEDGRLAGSIGALQMNLVARVNRPGDVVEDLATVRSC